MIEITPKQESMWPGFFAVVTPIFIIFALIFMYLGFNKFNRSITAIAKAQIVTGQFLNDYVPEIEERFKNDWNYAIGIEKEIDKIKSRIEIIEIVAPIYERRVSELENWKNDNCFVLCNRKKEVKP